MSVDAAPLRFSAPEEAARANFYALLARLFYAPPDPALLDSLAREPELEGTEGELSMAWRELSSAAARAVPDDIKAEFDTAFVGTGKAPVTLYACAYFRSEGELSMAWRELSSAAARAVPDDIKAEFDTAFVGTGKAPVTLYACAYS